MTSVLVTGTGGMGAHIVARLLRSGVAASFYGTGRQVAALGELVDPAKVPIYKGDILDIETLRTAVRKSAAERIIHTAGPRATQTRTNAAQGMRVHLVGTCNVMEVARLEDIERVVYTSSSSVYLSTKKGQSSSRPILEDDPVVPMNHEDVYATTKVACEYIGYNYAKAHNMSFIALRMSHVYGPWSGEMGRGGAISSMIRSSLVGEPLELEEQIAEWTHYYDLAEEHYLACFSRNVKVGAFNAGSGVISSLKEIREVLGQHVDTRKIIISNKFLTKRNVPSDITRAKDQLGYRPEYTIERAVKEFVDWWKSKLGLDREKPMRK
ncbi:MAG: NAD(P)-dependent oxidoreductase [Nitrososphaerales archaeon]